MEKFALSFSVALRPGQKILIQGELGAGKTFFVRSILKNLGLTVPIPSPTYTLINEYEVLIRNQNVLVRHLDLYRLRKEREVWELGIDEILQDPSIVFVEWADKFQNIFKQADLNIKIRVDSTGKRQISLHGFSVEGRGQ